MRLFGSLQTDGSTLTLNEGGNETAITHGSPSGNITITLPALTATLSTLALTETLTNKTLTSPTINGGTASALTGLSLRDTSAAFNVTLAATSTTALTAGRTLTIDVDDGARTLGLRKSLIVTTGDVTLAGNAAGSSVTLPASGTLATLAGSETLTNKTMGSTNTLTGATAASFTNSGNTITLPTSTSTLATLALSETLSNKTLTAVAGITLAASASIDWAAGNAALGASLGANTLSIGGASTTVRVVGNLQVDGTTTTVNSTTLEVADKNVLVNNGGNDASSEGAGLTVERTATNGSLIYKDASATKWAAGAAGAEVDLVGTSSTQTLTNKTLTTPVISQISNTGTLTLPTSTDTLVGRATTDTLTNKTLTSPVVATPDIDDYLDIREESAPSTPASGKVRIYAKTDKKVYKKNSDGVESELGAGSGGSGEKNYVTNPSGANDAAAAVPTGWANVGDLDIVVTKTAADLPREYTTVSGLKITADANTQSTADYVYYDFTLDDVDLSKKLKISWSQKTTGTYNAGDLAVVITTQADRTTALHTPVTTAIPASTGVFETTFDSGTTATLSLVIRATTDMTTDGGIVISDIVVGPGTVAQSAAVGSVTHFTPTWANATGLTISARGEYQRVGDALHLSVSAYFAGTGSDASPLRMNLPVSGITAANATHYAGGSMTRNTAAVETYNTFVIGKGANYVEFSNLNTVSGGTGINGDGFGDSGVRYYSLMFTVQLPIPEWAGNGTVNLGPGAQVEYAASTNGSWDDAAAAGNTIYGPGGAPITGSLSAARDKVVRFQYPIQATDRIEVQFSEDQVTWVPAGGTMAGEIYEIWHVNDGASAGVSWDRGTTVATDITVKFARYASYYTGAGAQTKNWQSGTYWRVVKATQSAPVGFGLAGTDGSSGLYKPGQAPGLTTAATIGAGYVGEKLTFTPRAVTTVSNNTWAINTSALTTLTPGVWIVYGYAIWVPGSSHNLIMAMISTSNSAAGTAGIGDGQHLATISTLAAAGNNCQAPMLVQYVNVSSNTPIYAHCLSEDSTASIEIRGFAARIA